MNNKREKTKNVFQIWMDLNKKLPFKVRRWSWHPTTYFEVTGISFRKKDEDYYKRTGDLYGSAQGYMFLRGKKVSDEEEGLGCAGCYQWELISNMNKNLMTLEVKK